MSYTNITGGLQQTGSTTDLSGVGKTGTAGKVPVGSAQAPTASGLGLGGDQTSLSSTASVLATALSGSDVRLDKVAALQQAISSGTYNVSASDVADKMIQSLLG